MKTSFERGDVVRLKSGGPLMTITEITNDNVCGDCKVHCKWFSEGGAIITDIFYMSALQLDD